MPRRAALLVCLGLAAGVAGAVLTSSNALALQPSDPVLAGPTADVDVSTAALGQLVRVQGTGWGADSNEVVTAVVCGNAAIDGAIDCDVASTGEGGIRAGGVFYAGVVVHAPPYPCPCVLRVTSRVTSAVVTVPLAITGVPVETPHPRVDLRRAVSVHDVRLTGRGPWTAWFGARPRRTLVYSVTNTGSVTLHSPTTDIAWGRGQSPTGFADAPDVGDLAVHQTKVFRVPIAFEPLSFGSYEAVVRTDPLGTVGSGQSKSTFVPWGLVVLVLVLFQLSLRHARARIRRRITLQGPPEAGWYADPFDGAMLRLWNGATWTEQLRQVVESAMAALPIEHGGSGQPEPGWYVDPMAMDQLRLWDGELWTDQVRPKAEHASAGHPT